MLKKEYYCLVAGLPDLFLNENKLGITSLGFRKELKDQLSHSDYQLIEYLFLPYDNENLLQLLFEENKPFNPNGLLSKKDLENQLSPANESIELPTYMVQFLDWKKQHHINAYSASVENKLYYYYYNYILKTNNNFTKSWFLFELNIKNILSAFNCKRFGYELAKQLVTVDQYSIVYSLLNRKKLRAELFEDDLPFSHEIFKVAESDLSLLEKEEALDKIRWDYLDENTFFHYFTIEKIISYTLKLLISERWLKLDKETGRVFLSQLINDLKTSYKFPEEFSLTK